MKTLKEKENGDERRKYEISKETAGMDAQRSDGLRTYGDSRICKRNGDGSELQSRYYRGEG